jgi:hypothetical protein
VPPSARRVGSGRATFVTSRGPLVARAVVDAGQVVRTLEAEVVVLGRSCVTASICLSVISPDSEEQGADTVQHAWTHCRYGSCTGEV